MGLLKQSCLLHTGRNSIWLRNMMEKRILRQFFGVTVRNQSDSSSTTNQQAESLPRIIQPNMKKAVSSNNSEKSVKISKVMKSYLERAKKYDDLLKDQADEFEIGRRHLANIMGKDPENFHQEDINEAISYLLPSGLYDIPARPVMLHPKDFMPRRKDAEFDVSGRPHEAFYYTMRPQFYNILHDAVGKLEALNKHEDAMIAQGKLDPDEKDILELAGSDWIEQMTLEKIILEKLKSFQYAEFVSCLNALAMHPYSYLEKDFIFQYRKRIADFVALNKFPEPIMGEDGRRYIEAEGFRKKMKVKVKITDRGSGIFTIDGNDITFFQSLQDREQIVFPIKFTGMLHQVDIEGTLMTGDAANSLPTLAGALRHAISNGLACFVSSEVREKMRIAGLLSRDFRTRERQKVGQKGARAKYTWLKR